MHFISHAWRCAFGPGSLHACPPLAEIQSATVQNTFSESLKRRCTAYFLSRYDYSTFLGAIENWESEKGRPCRCGIQAEMEHLLSRPGSADVYTYFWVDAFARVPKGGLREDFGRWLGISGGQSAHCRLLPNGMVVHSLCPSCW